MKNLIILFVALFLAACQELDPREPGLLVPRTVDQDPSLPSISVNNTQLHAQTFGNSSDPMLVILHGGPGSDYRYLLNCKAFANEGYYVVFYDQRGSGLSKREAKSSYTTHTMIDDLGAVIAYFRTSPSQKIFLLGQSWGGILATSYVNENPGAITGLVLTEPAGFVWSDIKDCIRRSRQYGITSETLNDVTYMDQFFTGDINDHAVLDYKMDLQSGNGKNKPTGDEAAVPFWRYGAVVNLAFMELGDREQPDWRANLGQYTTKVLFCYSEHNQSYGRDYAIHVSSAYPNVQLELIRGAGHDMLTFATGWNNFFPIALTYLNEIKGL